MAKAIMETNKGKIGLELFVKDAPNTVKNFVKLAKKGFYDGLKFHRVIKNFMIQGGCPQGTGSGGPGYQIKCEINQQKHTSGTLSMAHAGKDTGGSQFFITHTDTPHLDPRTIMTAFESLERHDAVIGPASDGGYYLLGLTKPRPALFRDIPWSTERVFEMTLALMKENSLSVERLETLTDIDLPKDLEMLARFRQAGHEPGPTHSQRALNTILSPNTQGRSSHL